MGHGPGKQRLKFLSPEGAGVFWPTRGDPNFPLVGTFGNQNLYAGMPSSDHKAVWLDVNIAAVPEGAPWAYLTAGLELLVALRRRRA